MDFILKFVMIIFFLYCFINGSHQIIISECDGLNVSPVSRHYSSSFLKTLNFKYNLDQNTYSKIPNEIKPRRRGKRGGVRTRNKNRKFRPFLPSVITGNAQSLNNKLDELCANVKFVSEFRNACLMCFSESWFDDRSTDEMASIDGFMLVRKDRSKQITGKERGGGVCMYVNERWCHKNNVRVVSDMCTPDIEILSVVLRPFYLPREFPKITANIVYIPPDANYTAAVNVIADHVHRQQTACPDGVNFITGDFNDCNLSRVLPSFHQHINIPTRKDKIIDHFYTNVKKSYRCFPLPPLGKSDHNLTHLLPTYKPVLKMSKCVTRDVSKISDDAWESLKGCYDCTDWNVLIDSCDSFDEKVDVCL